LILKTILAGLLGILFLFGGHTLALAEKRVALVIGNSTYKNVSPLPNPTNAAAAVEALLRAAGFDLVDSRQNLGNNDMRRAIREFTNQVRDADIAVVYYAGHGIEIDGINYLLPIDAKLEQDTDADDEAIPLDRLIRVLEPAKRLRLVILDACRENPFARTMKRSLGTRTVTRGLAKVEPTSTDTLIAYAAKAGSTAADGADGNSPFTKALLNNLAVPGLDLRIAFGRVRDDVLKATGNRQEPFVYGSLGGQMVSLVPAPEAPKAQPPIADIPVVVPNIGNDIRRDYELTKEVGTRGAWEAFLAKYNIGIYADLAREQLAKLDAEEAKKKTPPSTAAVPPPAAPPAAAAPSAPPPAQRSTEAPKPSTGGSGNIVCTKSGCQELKPGCKAVTAPGKIHADVSIVCQ